MKRKFVLVLMVLSVFLSGCYINEVLLPSQMAVQLEKGSIINIAGPGGIYSGGFFEELVIIDIGTITFSVEDPEVLTSDNQAVGLKVTIQARRKSDKESITNLVQNWNSLVSNQVLQDTISATAREGMKNGVRNYTLSQLLNDRNGLGNAIKEQLEADSQKYSVEIINVTIENVAPSAEYMTILSEKANLTAETERELERQKLIEQQASNDVLQAQKNVEVAEARLLAERAQTAVEVEIASREGEKVAAQYAVYQQNPQAFALRQLELMKALFNDKTVYFIPAGTDLNLWGMNSLALPE